VYIADGYMNKRVIVSIRTQGRSEALGSVMETLQKMPTRCI